MHQAVWVFSRKGFLVEAKKQIEKSLMSKDEIFQKNLTFFTDYINELSK